MTPAMTQRQSPDVHRSRYAGDVQRHFESIEFWMCDEIADVTGTPLTIFENKLSSTKDPSMVASLVFGKAFEAWRKWEDVLEGPDV